MTRKASHKKLTERGKFKMWMARKPKPTTKATKANPAAPASTSWPWGRVRHSGKKKKSRDWWHQRKICLLAISGTRTLQSHKEVYTSSGNTSWGNRSSEEYYADSHFFAISGQIPHIRRTHNLKSVALYFKVRTNCIGAHFHWLRGQNPNSVLVLPTTCPKHWY